MKFEFCRRRGVSEEEHFSPRLNSALSQVVTLVGGCGHACPKKCSRARGEGDASVSASSDSVCMVCSILFSAFAGIRVGAEDASSSGRVNPRAVASPMVHGNDVKDMKSHAHAAVAQISVSGLKREEDLPVRFEAMMLYFFPFLMFTSQKMLQ